MLTELLDQLGDMSTLGICITVALLAFGEAAILLDLVVPGEVGLVIAGAAAVSGDHPILPVIVAASIGALAGDTTSYLVGRRWGRRLIERFDFTRRRMTPAMNRAENYFGQHGGRAVFVARWIGALRAVVPFIAGIGRLRFRTFLAWSAPAALLWGTAAVLAGATFGRRVAAVVDRLEILVSVLAILSLTIFWLRRRPARSAKGPSVPSPFADGGTSDPVVGARGERTLDVERR